MQQPSHHPRKKLLNPIIWIGLISVLPIVLAYVIYTNQQLLPERTSNQGYLLRPGVHLDVMGDAWLNPDQKWLLLTFVTESSCDADCLQLLEKQMYRMRQVQIAMNRNSDRMERHVLMADERLLSALNTQLKAYPYMQVHPLDITPWQQMLGNYPGFSENYAYKNDGLGSYIFVVDPRNYIVAFYHHQQHSGKNMIRDLTKLLRYSQIG